MPFSFNGIGTRYYGHRDISDSGTYTATEWIVFLWLPIFPLRSWRVSRKRSGIDTILFSDASYFVKHIPLNLRQVLLGYLSTLAAFGAMVAVASLLLTRLA
jgi:hypothetical protein